MGYISLREEKEKNLDKLLVEKNNDDYFFECKHRYKDLFNNVNGYALDDDQIKCVINEDDSLLINAGAGSGKSLTLIGKIKYLVEVKKVNYEDILVISFTNESCKSFKNKISYDIDVFTFHRLGLEIIKKYRDVMIVTDELDFIIEEVFNDKECRKLLKGVELNKFSEDVKRFISMYKNREDIDFKDILKNNFSYKMHKLYKVIYIIYIRYKKHLEDNDLVDFDDMVNKALEYISEEYVFKEYKYIIIDEYQDSSDNRINLIKKILSCTGAKLIVVGDDFQSIYRFTGSNINLFLNFTKLFEYSKVLSINNTYRNCQQLIDVAGGFVMKNKFQLRKSLNSNLKLDKPIKFYYGSLDKLVKLLYDKEVLILGRNNRDIYKYDIDLASNCKYMTVHKSKGLESEVVIMVNLLDDINGFPSKRENSDVLKVMDYEDKFLYEEERRLFYVGLTRTKSVVYLLIEENPSVFVNELYKDYKKFIEIIK